MVYGTKYRIEYCDKYGRQARLDIEIKDYSGDVNMVEGTPDVFKLSYSNENGDKTGYIIHSVADISLYENPITIDDIKTLSETDIRISFYIDSVIFWQGFAIPDFFETEIGSNAVISISASDRISTLKKVTFTASLSREKLIKLISQCLLATGLDLPVVTVVDFLLEAEQSVHSGTDDLLGDMYGSRQRIVNDKGESISAFDVLRSILVLSNAYLVQRKNEWWIVNKEQIDYGYGNVRRYASDGTFISKTTFTQSVQSFRDIHIGGRKTIAAAALDVSVFSELGGAIVGNPDPFLELWVNNSFSAIQSENGATQHFSDKVVTGYSGSVALFGTETKKNALRIREQVYLGDNKPTMQPCFRVFVKQIVDAAYKIDLKIDVTGRTGMTVGYSIVVESIVGYTFLRLNSNGGWTMSIGSNISSGHIKSKQITGAVGGVSTMQITDSFNLDTDVDLGEGHGEYNIYILLFGTQGQAMDYFVESVQVRLNQLNEPPKGTIFKIEQKNDFSKSYETDTTVFGEYLNSGVNGYFYAFPENDSSIITLSSGYVPDPEWSTINDQNPETLLMKGVRQRADSLSTARSVLSVSMEIKDIDPLAIFKASCNNDRFSLVECQFDFLKSTAILKLEERTSSSALKKDFIYSYFGDRDDDNIRSIGTASGSTTVGSPPPSSGGGGSFLDKYFSFDEANNALVANVNLVSEKEIAAYFADGSIPSIFDNFPFATSESTGGIKASSTYQNGIRINSSGFLEVDPSYAGGGVSSWNDLTNRPVWLTPTTKALFEAGHGHTWGQITGKPSTFAPSAHNHIIGDITGLQAALDGKKPNFSENTAFNKNFGTAAGTVAQGNDSRINNGQTAYGWGNHALFNYATKQNLDDLEIGGVNYLKDSAEFDNNWSPNVSGLIAIEPSDEAGINQVKHTGEAYLGQETSVIGFDFSDTSQTFTISVYAKAQTSGTVGLTLSGSHVNYMSKPLTQGWEKYVWTFKGIGSALWLFRFNVSGASEENPIYIKKPSIFLGDKATDWTPNPEDVTAYVDNSILDTRTWIQNTGTAYNSSRLGGVVASDYARKTQNETITGIWNFNNIGLGNGLITYDPINDTIRFNKTVVSDFDIVAFTDSGQSLPSIFDNLPKTSRTSFGVVKVGAGINVSGGVISLDIGSIAPQTLSFNGVDNKLSISGGNTVDLSGLTPDLTGYATENWVQLGFKPIAYQPTWGQITGKPSTFAPSMHNHIIGDITGLQTALNAKENTIAAGTTAQYWRGDKSWQILNTTVVPEGTNLYHTNARVKAYADTLYSPLAHTHTPAQVGLGNVGNYSDYARKGQDETITGKWSFNDNVVLRGDRNTLALYYNIDGVAKSRVNEIILGRETDFHKWRILNQSTLEFGNGPTLSFQHLGPTGSVYTDVLTMTFGRNVGIGIATPTERLHVVGNGLFSGNIIAGAGLNVNGNIESTGLMKVTHPVPRYEFHQTDVQNATRWVLDGVSMQMQVIEYGTSAFLKTPFAIDINAPSGSFGVSSTGLVTTGSDLYVGGNVTAQGEVTAYSSSDQRLKKNIKTIESAIDTINKLNPVSFNWNEKAIELNSAKDSDRVNYGLIAQEIEEVLPELVHQTNGYKSVDYIQLIGVLLAGMKELNNKIKNLENR